MVKILPIPKLEAEIDISTYCQLACPFCRTGSSLREKYDNLYGYDKIPRGFMTRETFSCILEKIPQLSFIRLYNWGEPLLNKDIVWFISEATSRGKKVEIGSNLQIMTSELAEGLIKSGLHTIVVSCDGTTQEIYETYRKGGDLNKVLEYARMLSETKKRLNKNNPIIDFQLVVTKFNHHEMGETYRKFAIGNGADAVRYSMLCTMTPDGYHLLNDYYCGDPKYKYFKIGQLTNCITPFAHVSIDFNGDVYTCCNPSGIIKWKMGNINESSFEDIWNGEKFQYARRFCKTGIPEDNGFEIMCHSCYNKFPSEEMKERDFYRSVLSPFKDQK